MNDEIPLVISGDGSELIGVLHRADPRAQVAVLVIVGGPQYRVGSHRQFVLLARALACHGIPVLRFDYSGMGDSNGPPRTFDDVDADVARAADALCAQLPGVRQIILWGLCDAASAALFYAQRDPRVRGLVLLNPWVRTEAGQARAYMKHHYLQRLVSGEFWKKVLGGHWDARATWRSLRENLQKLRRPAAAERRPAEAAAKPVLALPDRMAQGWENYSGPVLLILSGNNDFVADEFRDLVKDARRWKRLLAGKNVTRREFPEANHTFSRADWREQVALMTVNWIRAHE